MQTFKVKNKITGFIFNLPKEECDRLIIEEPHNFTVIDKKYNKPDIAKKSEKSIFEKVAGETQEDDKEK